MKSSTISTFKDRFWLSVNDHRDVERAGRSSNGVWWIAHRDGWFRPCWVWLSEYSPGCIRIRNDIRVPIPKSAWPLQTPHYGGPTKFELTFHDSELTDGIHELIFSCCSVPGFRFHSPLFSESGDVPAYAWTTRGKEHYDATHKKD